LEGRKTVFRETGFLLAGLVPCVLVMIGVYALLGRLTDRVWLGALFGLLLAVGNFFFMAVAASTAADRATEMEDVSGGRKLMTVSYLARLAVMALLLIACVKGGLCDGIAMVLPLLFVRPVLMLTAFFREKPAQKGAD